VVAVAALIAWRATSGDDGSSDLPAGDSAEARLVPPPAKDLVPDLTPLGYRQIDEFATPLNVPGQDQYRRVFARPEMPDRLAVVDITVHSTLENAITAYELVAEQWGNPPPGVFTGIDRFEETPSPAVGDEQRSYVSTNADSSGNRAWTDVYRAGNVVIVIQVLDEGATDQMDLRTEIAQRTVDGLH